MSLANVVVGVIMGGVLVTSWRAYDSQLALAQAADSIVDTFTALALWWAVRVSRDPPDENHPAGHHAAEPLGALLVAVLAGALAIEVATEAVGALQGKSSPRLDASLAAAFSVKLVAKLGIAVAAAGSHRRQPSPALRAIAVDARNDVLVGGVALAGFVGARYGSAAVDALLALPLALWIGVSAVLLGVENTRLLMGEAAPAERRSQLRDMAARIPGVRAAHSVKAHYRGRGIFVWLQIAVDPDLTVVEGHDIGEAVEAALRSEADVIDAFVHVDVK